MKHPLVETIDKIEFENKHKYIIKIDFHDFEEDIFTLIIKRQIVCSITNRSMLVNNNKSIARSTTSHQLVQTVFMAIGQFEAHEFCESFRYKGIHAYFPHDDAFESRDVPFLYGKSNRINDLILSPWRDILNNTNDLYIGMRYISNWFDDKIDKIDKKIFSISFKLARAWSSIMKGIKNETL